MVSVLLGQLAQGATETIEAIAHLAELLEEEQRVLSGYCLRPRREHRQAPAQVLELVPAIHESTVANKCSSHSELDEAC